MEIGFVRDQARVPSVAGAVAPFFVTGTVFLKTSNAELRVAPSACASAVSGALTSEKPFGSLLIKKKLFSFQKGSYLLRRH